MSLRHLLLGLLDEPRSGYDMKPMFDDALRHFWPAELAQIYPTLNRLEKEGLATSDQVASERGPARRVYRRTKKGTEALADWLMEGPTLGQDRHPYLVQVFFLAALSPAERVRFFTDLAAHFRSELEGLQAIDDYWRGQDPRVPDMLPDEDYCRWLTLRLGLKKYAAILAWAEECLAELRVRAEQPKARQG